MHAANGCLDKYAMTELARRTLVDLKKRGLPPVELNRLEACLKEGKVGEVYVLSGLLKTVLDETSPDASQKKLLQIYRALEHSYYSLVELSRSLWDVEVWQHYKTAGYDTFDSYCLRALELSPAKIQRLMVLKDQFLPRPGKTSPTQLISWLFDAIDLLANGEREHVIQ